jgi:tetratricopeptide (TPR) repeat protein
MKFSKKFWLAGLLIWGLFGGMSHAISSLDTVACGSLGENYLGKPTDFRSAPADQRNLVEGAHFRVEHAQLQAGKTSFKHGENSGSLMGGFDYTLRVFPNHHLALQDIDRLGMLLKTEKPINAKYTLDCYYQRAIAFVPEDGMVRLLYGLYLIRRAKTKDALQQLRLAEEYSPDDINVQYNLGLAYFQAKEYRLSQEYAKRAYDRGFPLPGLKQMLIKAGKWE